MTNLKKDIQCLWKQGKSIKEIQKELHIIIKPLGNLSSLNSDMLRGNLEVTLNG